MVPRDHLRTDAGNWQGSKGLKIGSCFGYPAVVTEKVVELARENGYVTDHVVATDEVPNGRPLG